MIEKKITEYTITFEKSITIMRKGRASSFNHDEAVKEAIKQAKSEIDEDWIVNVEDDEQDDDDAYYDEWLEKELMEANNG